MSDTEQCAPHLMKKPGHVFIFPLSEQVTRLILNIGPQF